MDAEMSTGVDGLGFVFVNIALKTVHVAGAFLKYRRCAKDAADRETAPENVLAHAAQDGDTIVSTSDI